MTQTATNLGHQELGFLSGGGEMGERIRAFDWAGTPLGPVESWSPALRTTLRIVLANRFPHILWWGPHYIQFYNDAYRPIPGAKHPHRVLGQPASECWAEIWHVIGPLIDTPFRGGPATWNDDIELEVYRNGFFEESHFTIAYSPVPDDTVPSGIGGVLATVHEITEKVIGERRTIVLRDLGARVGEARSADDACAAAAAALEPHGKDIPFALFYLVDEAGHLARLTGSIGVDPGRPISPASVDLAQPESSGWPLAGALSRQAALVLEDIGQRFGDVPRGPWSDAPQTAVVMPIPGSKPQEVAGLLILGASARLRFDQSYRDFFDLVRIQVAAAIAHARAYEEERRRAETLAELDLAKTRFFSNVSHEFRTPLTLMLGPVEDMLHAGSTDVPAALKEQLEVVHRNSLRLLKLVNTMLDFSRIEAGRMTARYEAVDLAAYTAELVSSFRSACERAGLRLVVDCPPLTGEPAYVDLDMWEKLVLNLLSNAFKFTLEGEIEVRLESAGDTARLVVRDTGEGIPADELPRMFDRFHRVEHTRGRTHEGTGIGLALVQELARLHGGTVRVDSALGQGSTFVVTLPLGRRHLDPAKVRESSDGKAAPTNAAAYVEEALRWLPAPHPEAQQSWIPMSEGLERAAEQRPAAAHVLVAEDNSDMLAYITRLLGASCVVEPVGDGQAALAAARRRRPDLILSDVMMPRLDGYGLLRELRGDPDLREVPVILLSARAGEEARIEGLGAGADDYLVKPFSARELVARVEAQVRLEQQRRDSEAQLRRAHDELANRLALLERANAEVRDARAAALASRDEALQSRDELARHVGRFETLINQAPMGVYLVDADFRIREVNPVALPVFGDVPGGVIGRDFDEVIHVLWRQEYADEVVRIFRHTLETGEPYETAEHAEFRADRGVKEYYEWRLDRIALPDGRFGVVCYFRDISAQVQARGAVAQAAERHRTLVSVVTDVTWVADPTGAFRDTQAEWAAYTGQPFEAYQGFGWTDALHPDDRATIRDRWESSIRSGGFSESAARVWHAASQQYRHCVVRAAPIKGADGSVEEWVGAYTDVHERELAAVALRNAERLEAVGRLAGGVAHEANNQMTVVLGSTEFALRGADLAPETREELWSIRRAAERTAAITSQLLAFGRRQLLQREAVDLNLVLNAFVPVLRRALGESNELVLQLSPDVGPVLADRGQIEQVLVNLTLNARDAMPAGGRLTLSTGSVWIGGSAGDRQRDEPLPPAFYGVLTARDTGHGMDRAVLARVFDPFFTTKPQGQGSGLGLSSVHGIVRQLGGDIRVQSTPGEGTTFEIYLPFADQTSASPEPPFGRRVSGGAGTVLLVEDEPSVRASVARALRSDGFQVLEAEHGQAALDLLDRHSGPVAAVVSDVALPVMGGGELIQRLQRARPEIPVLLISGYAAEELVRRGMLDRLRGELLPKPFDPATLVERVRAVIDAGKIAAG
jgi:PAS domain S-box-containing protein